MSLSKDQMNGLEILMEKLRKPLDYNPPPLDNSRADRQQNQTDTIWRCNDKGNVNRVTVRDLLDARRLAKQSQEIIYHQPLEQKVGEQGKETEEVQAPDLSPPSQQSQTILQSPEQKFSEEAKSIQEVQIPDFAQSQELLPQPMEQKNEEQAVREVQVSDLVLNSHPEENVPIVNKIDDVAAENNFNVTPSESMEVKPFRMNWRLQSLSMIPQGVCPQLKVLVPYDEDGNPIQLPDDLTNFECPLFETDTFPTYANSYPLENDYIGANVEIITTMESNTESRFLEEKRQNVNQQIPRDLNRSSVEISSRQKRKKRIAAPESGENFICHICHAEFQHHCRLEKHIQTHTGEYLFRCPCTDCGDIPFRDYRTMKRFHNNSFKKVRKN